jgi:hypothetical protein
LFLRQSARARRLSPRLRQLPALLTPLPPRRLIKSRRPQDPRQVSPLFRLQNQPPSRNLSRQLVEVPEKELLPVGEVRTMLKTAMDGDDSALSAYGQGGTDRASLAIPYPKGYAALRIETMPYLIEDGGYKEARGGDEPAGRLSVLAVYTRQMVTKEKFSDRQSKIALPPGVVAKSVMAKEKSFEATLTFDGEEITVAGAPRALDNWANNTRMVFKPLSKATLMDAMANFVAKPMRINGALHARVAGKFSAIYAADASTLYAVQGLQITKISLGEEIVIEKVPLTLGERPAVNGQAAGHPSNPWVAFGDGHGTLYHADVNTGELLGTYETKGAMTIDVKWLPDGKRFVASHNGGMVSLVDIESAMVVSPESREKPLSGEPRLAVSPSGTYIAGLQGARRGDTRPQVWRWKSETPMEVEAISPVRENATIGAMAFLADDLVVLGWSDGQIDTYSLPEITQKDLLVKGEGTRFMPMDIQVLPEQLVVSGRYFCRIRARADGALQAEVERYMLSWNDFARVSPRHDSITFPREGKVKVSPFPFK